MVAGMTSLIRHSPAGYVVGQTTDGRDWHPLVTFPTPRAAVDYANRLDAAERPEVAPDTTPNPTEAPGPSQKELGL